MVAGGQVDPPSVETSTPATTAPPDAVAVPVTFTLVPSATVAPAPGAETADVGAVRLVDAVAAVRPAMRVAGCAPMSARRFTVACCMLRSTAPPPGFSASRPQAH